MLPPSSSGRRPRDTHAARSARDRRGATRCSGAGGGLHADAPGALSPAARIEGEAGFRWGRPRRATGTSPSAPTRGATTRRDRTSLRRGDSSGTGTTEPTVPAPDGPGHDRRAGRRRAAGAGPGRRRRQPPRRRRRGGETGQRLGSRRPRRRRAPPAPRLGPGHPHLERGRVDPAVRQRPPPLAHPGHPARRPARRRQRRRPALRAVRRRRSRIGRRTPRPLPPPPRTGPRRLLPGQPGGVGHPTRGLAGEHRRRPGRGRRRGARPGGGPAHPRPPRRRRLHLRRSVHPDAGAGRVGADPAGLRADGRAPVPERPAVHAARPRPVPARAAAGADQRSLRQGLQRGEARRSEHQRGADRRPDPPRPLLGRRFAHRLEPHREHRLRAEGLRPAPDRPAAGAAEHGDGRRLHRRLVSEAATSRSGGR